MKAAWSARNGMMMMRGDIGVPENAQKYTGMNIQTKANKKMIKRKIK